ncbi:histidine phosphatase family protein [Rhizobiaceae bacterium BDR2-2]|uniref:Histidine phosphatase family protein n=1 Tax=Ectorhizobium quercum TaxID=2965071 RepID=A0AAE3SWR0_9HYPH|nr:histidine phosphatase family protein [Ectorhizobium quercum]MCX8997675.1 histidine phosphatase family protein [Ectorhizobium quercum]
MTAASLPLQRIFLLRHAQAAWPAPGESDFDRALDDRGRAEASVIAGLIAGKGYLADRVVCSAARRCRETAETVCRAFGRDFPIRIVNELYHGVTDSYLAVIDAETDAATLMIVGHNPTIEELLETLVGSDTAWAVMPGGYPTAGFCVIERNLACETGWALSDFLTP